MRLITQPSLESVFGGSEGVWAGDPRRGDRAPSTCMEVLPYCPLPSSGGGKSARRRHWLCHVFQKKYFLHSDGEGGGQEEIEAEGRFSEGNGGSPKHEGRQRACAHTCMQTWTWACRCGRGRPPCGRPQALPWAPLVGDYASPPWWLPSPPPGPSLPVSSYTSLPALRTLRPPIS